MPASDHGLDALLTHVDEARGFDFTGYKLSTLQRRLQRRLDAVGVDGYEAYGEYLEVHPDEYDELFNAVLINVTGFFRDPETWEVIAGKVVPEIALARPDGQIRVWSAGCASGEEAYSIAMLLAESLGE